MHNFCQFPFTILSFRLDIKQGKTSMKQMVEEYEEEKTFVHERLGLRQGDLLPQRKDISVSKRVFDQNKEQELSDLTALN